MSLLPQSRAQVRALAGAALVAGGLGGVLAGAYWAGAHTAPAAAQAQAHGTARRPELVLRGPEAVGDDPAQQRGAALLAARAVARLDGAATLAPGATTPERPRLMLLTGPAAAPFRTAGALETSRDLDCLTAAVYYETGNDVAAGQAAVAQVVLNRVRHPAFPKSVCGVVFQGAGSGHCQFSFVCDGAMRRPKSQAMWENARKVAARALGGYVMPEAGQAVSFHAAYLGRLWPSMQRIGQIGAHVFYRFGHGGGFDNGVYTAEHKPDVEGLPAAPADRPVFADAGGDGRLAVMTAAPSLVAQSIGGPTAAGGSVKATKPASGKSEEQPRPQASEPAA